jgi:hypothetical protein
MARRKRIRTCLAEGLKNVFHIYKSFLVYPDNIFLPQKSPKINIFYGSTVNQYIHANGTFQVRKNQSHAIVHLSGDGVENLAISYWQSLEIQR